MSRDQPVGFVRTYAQAIFSHERVEIDGVQKYNDGKPLNNRKKWISTSGRNDRGYEVARKKMEEEVEWRKGCVRTLREARSSVWEHGVEGSNSPCSISSDLKEAISPYVCVRVKSRSSADIYVRVPCSISRSLNEAISPVRSEIERLYGGCVVSTPSMRGYLSQTW